MVFPVPERYGYSFLGWYGDGWNKPEKYDESMPEQLTLTALWKYDEPADNSGAGYGVVLTYKSDQPEIILTGGAVMPTNIYGLTVSDPYSGLYDQPEDGYFTETAARETLDAVGRKNNATGYYVGDSSEILKAMTAAERRVLGLDSVAYNKLLELPMLRVETLYGDDDGDGAVVLVVPHKVVFGETFVGTKLSSIVVLKWGGGKTESLAYQPSAAAIGHGQYAWTQKNGTDIPLNTAIQMAGEEMYLMVAVTDGSSFDSDKETKGSVLDPVVLADLTGAGTTGGGGGNASGYEAGGGCDAGFGLAAIGALIAAAAARRRGKRG
jgi:uncharacterized repeat protein (TIGR02543 family)